MKRGAFKLDNHVQSPLTLKSITRLPKHEILQQIEDLAPGLQSRLRDCIKNIYSHVTERIPDEESEHFFHHVASSVWYENFTQTLIKGKDHAKKAASLWKMIDDVITEIEKWHRKSKSAGQSQILLQYKYMLIVHKNALTEALQNCALDIKNHLLKFQKLDIDNLELEIVPEEVKSVVEHCYPNTPSPLKGRRRTITLNDHQSINYINVKRKLFESESSEEEKALQSFLDDCDNGNDSFEWDSSESSSFEDPLAKKMNTLVFSGPSWNNQRMDTKEIKKDNSFILTTKKNNGPRFK